MLKLSKRQVQKYLHRSYAAVDGLWFVKTEEKIGFRKALEIDKEVWKVMGKIQARALKEFAGKSGAKDCFETKLQLDGFKFRSKKLKGGGFEIRIKSCPWRETLIKSGRKKYAERIGSAICASEFPVWTREFGGELSETGFELISRICGGGKNCVFKFNASNEKNIR